MWTVVFREPELAWLHCHFEAIAGPAKHARQRALCDGGIAPASECHKATDEPPKRRASRSVTLSG